MLVLAQGQNLRRWGFPPIERSLCKFQDFPTRQEIKRRLWASQPRNQVHTTQIHHTAVKFPVLPSRKLLKLPRPKNEFLLIWFDLHFRLLGDLHFRQVLWSQFGEGFVFFQDIRSRLIAIFCTRPCSLIPRAVCWFRISQNLASCEVNWYSFLELKLLCSSCFQLFEHGLLI